MVAWVAPALGPCTGRPTCSREQRFLRRPGSGPASGEQLGAQAGPWSIPPRDSSRSAWSSSRMGIFHLHWQGPDRQDRLWGGGWGLGGERALPRSHCVTLGTASHSPGPRLPTHTRAEAGAPTPPGLGGASLLRIGAGRPSASLARTSAQGSTDEGSRMPGSGPPSRTQIPGGRASTPGLQGQGLAQTSVRLHLGPLLPPLWEHHCPEAAAAGPCTNITRSWFPCPHSIDGETEAHGSLSWPRSHAGEN